MATKLVASDLEGVFVPEIWPIIGGRLGIPELSATTRDIPDFRRLMESRIEAIRRHDISFSTIESVLRSVTPFRGADKAMTAISSIPGVKCAIISDSFEEFIDIVLGKHPGWRMFANHFSVSHDRIESCSFDVGGQKGEVLRKLKAPTDTVLAIGDSFNDVDMLRGAQFRILFNPISDMRNQFMDSITCNNFESLVENIKRLLS